MSRKIIGLNMKERNDVATKFRKPLFSVFCIICKMDRYISGAEVKKAFSVFSCALRRWAGEGRVKATRMVGGRDSTQRMTYHLIFGKRI